MKSYLTLFAAALLWMLPFSQTHGQSFQTQTQSFTPLSPSFDSETNPSLPSLIFNQFNTSLGDLLSIQVTTYLAVDGGQIIIDNDGVDPSDVTVSLGADADFTPNGVSFLDTTFITIGQGVTAQTSDTFIAVSGNDLDSTSEFNNDGGPDNRTHLGGQDSNSDSGFINSIFWGGYTGTGTFTVDYAGSNIVDILGDGGVSGSFVPALANGSVEIVYEYNAVPEPGSALLLGAGALCALVRRRRPAASVRN